MEVPHVGWCWALRPPCDSPLGFWLINLILSPVEAAITRLLNLFRPEFTSTCSLRKVLTGD